MNMLKARGTGSQPRKRTQNANSPSSKITSYEEIKKQIGEKTFKIIHSPRIITEKEKGCEHQTMRAYIDSYKHMQYIGTDKKGNECLKSFVYDWLEDAPSHIRRYDYIVFKTPPLKVNGNEFNTIAYRPGWQDENQ
jgi:hypothetical protein